MVKNLILIALFLSVSASANFRPPTKPRPSRATHEAPAAENTPEQPRPEAPPTDNQPQPETQPKSKYEPDRSAVDVNTTDLVYIPYESRLVFTKEITFKLLSDDPDVELLDKRSGCFTQNKIRCCITAEARAFPVTFKPGNSIVFDDPGQHSAHPEIFLHDVLDDELENIRRREIEMKDPKLALEPKYSTIWVKEPPFVKALTCSKYDEEKLRHSGVTIAEMQKAFEGIAEYQLHGQYKEPAPKEEPKVETPKMPALPLYNFENYDAFRTAEGDYEFYRQGNEFLIVSKGKTRYNVLGSYPAREEAGVTMKDRQTGEILSQEQILIAPFFSGSTEKGEKTASISATFNDGETQRFNLRTLRTDEEQLKRATQLAKDLQKLSDVHESLKAKGYTVLSPKFIPHLLQKGDQYYYIDSAYNPQPLIKRTDGKYDFHKKGTYNDRVSKELLFYLKNKDKLSGN